MDILLTAVQVPSKPTFRGLFATAGPGKVGAPPNRNCRQTRGPIHVPPTFLLVLACALGLGTSQPRAAEPNLDRHLTLGMPAKAATDKSHKDAYLLKKEFFTISYNNSKGTPNWVAWNLRKDDFGDAARPKDAFHPDSELPTGFLKVRPTDYKFTTSFERGHCAPTPTAMPPRSGRKPPS